MTMPRNSPRERPVLDSRARHAVTMGPEANARLTASTAIVLLILLAIEGVTVVRVGPLLTVHVFIGMLLIPPVLVKLSSTLWRFAKYYLGSSDYRHKGPPPLALRLLGPFVAVLTIVLFASGVLTLLGPTSLRSPFLLLHKVSFFLWFACMTVHVLGHLGETAKVGTKDWTSRASRVVAGSKIRRLILSASLIVGLILSFITIPHVGPWIAGA
jgi:hypothetical protein